MSTEDNILAIVRNHHGIKAKEIAMTLGLQKSVVNSILYRLQTRQECYEEGYVWFANEIQRDKTRNNIVIGATSQNGIAVDEILCNLCKYYLNCLALDESNAVSLFQTSNYATAYIEVNGTEKERICTEDVNLFMNNARAAQKALFLGYPVMVDNRTGRNGTAYRFLSPIFMFPIEYSAGDVQICQFPRINLELMRKYASMDKNEQILELVKLENDLGLNDPDAEFDIEDLIMKLQKIRDWDWKDSMKPDSLFSFDESISEIAEDGIYNKAIVFYCDRSPYTQGLENELELLSHKGESDYRGTALYDWIHRSVNDDVKSESNDSSLLEVLPLNIEQGDAVRRAINSKLTIVTGPPGTGKSQVVTDLIVNLAWKGKSALFSSKNNKAVDVVEQRVNNLGTSPVMIRLGSASNTSSLIEFFKSLLSIKSGTPSEHNDYNLIKARYDEYVSQAKVLSDQKSQIVSERNRIDELERSFCIIRDEWSEHINKISNADIADIKAKLASYNSAWCAAQKNRQPLYIRLLWFIIKGQRLANLEVALNASINSSGKFLRNDSDLHSAAGHAKWISDNEKMIDKMSLAFKYQEALKHLESSPSLEKIDKKLQEISEQQDNIAGILWNRWLAINTTPVREPLRGQLSDFIAQAQLADTIDINDDPTLKRMYSSIKSQLNNLLPITAITSLSANRRIPLQAGIYDVLIIDEASQCDIASIVPLLYRAKQAVIIGDPK